MKRTKLRDRQLPDYSRGEEIFNMVSHIVGGAFGIVALVLCVVFSAIHHNPWAVVSSSIYGASLIVLYTISSVYHGLRKNTGKKVMQILDHCTIYFLIAGTYTPVLLVSLRPEYPGWAWSLFGVVWGLSAMATVFTAIDLKKYNKLSFACYLAIGWCIVIAIKPVLECVPIQALLLILAGGIVYSIGALIYNLGKTKKYMHCLFHIFVLLGTALQFIAIFAYII